MIDPVCEDCKSYKENFCTKKNIEVKKDDKKCDYFKNKYQVYKVLNTRFLKSTDF